MCVGRIYGLCTFVQSLTLRPAYTGPWSPEKNLWGEGQNLVPDPWENVETEKCKKLLITFQLSPNL